MEPPRECGVFFHVLAVLIERGGTNTVQLTTCERRLDEIGGIHCAVRLARTHKRMHLVDEKNDFASGFGHFGQHGLEPLFELTAILRTRDQRTHVEGEQTLVAQAFRHVAVDDAQGKAFGNRRLTDTRLTNENGVVLGPAAEHLHRAANFLITSDDRVNLTRFGALGEIHRVFLEGIVPIFGSRGIGGTPFTHLVDRRIQPLRCHLAGIQRILGARFDHRKCHQNAFDRHKAVTGFFSHGLSFGENLRCGAIKINLCGIARHLGHLGEGLLYLLHDLSRVSARGCNEVGSQPLLVVHQCFE